MLCSVIEHGYDPISFSNCTKELGLRFVLLYCSLKTQCTPPYVLTVYSSSRGITVLKMSSFRSKSGQKLCRNQSKSVKFVTSYAGHVDGIKK